MYKFEVVLGDWSHDGHGHTDSFYIESNFSHEDWQRFYLMSCKTTGLAFKTNSFKELTGLDIDWKHPEYDDRHIATEYENNIISKLACNILCSYSLEFKQLYDEYKEDDGTWFINDTELFLDILYWFCKISEPSLNYTLVLPDTKKWLTGFGYGIFSD